MNYWFGKYFELYKRHINLKADRIGQSYSNQHKRIVMKQKQDEIDKIARERDQFKREIARLKTKIGILSKCRKAIFYDEDEAFEFAVLMRKRNKQFYIIYACPSCPINSIGMAPFHITHASKEERGKHK